ncbi:MAG: short-chain dehydrogenase, partial [Acidovorax sp.]
MPATTAVTVITGASNGIGRAIAEAVLAQGRAVVNLDYVLPTWSHPLLTSYQGDLTDEASTRERA